MPSKNRSHYSGSYSARAAAVRTAANADPSTRCWRCGLTLEQKRRTHPRATWHAGHTVDGNSQAPLLAEHSVCNTSAGARAGNIARGQRTVIRPSAPQPMPRSQRWY